MKASTYFVYLDYEFNWEFNFLRQLYFARYLQRAHGFSLDYVIEIYSVVFSRASLSVLCIKQCFAFRHGIIR